MKIDGAIIGVQLQNHVSKSGLGLANKVNSDTKGIIMFPKSDKAMLHTSAKSSQRLDRDSFCH